MKSLQQFFALFRFHATSSPWLWIFPVFIGTHAFLMTYDHYHDDLRIAGSIVFPLWWMPVMMAFLLFSPEIFAGNPWVTAQTMQQTQSFNMEFLATRAVDRRNIFWARYALYWLLIILPVLMMISAGIVKPSFSLEIFQKAGETAAKTDYYLTHFSGSFVEKTTKSGSVIIQVPAGGFHLKLASSVVFFASAVACQFFVMCILRLRFRKWFFWGAILAGSLSPVFLILHGKGLVEGVSFFIFAHPVAIPVVLLLGAAAVSFAGLANFLKLEYP